MSCVEVVRAGWRWMEQGGAGWSWVNDLVIPVSKLIYFYFFVKESILIH